MPNADGAAWVVSGTDMTVDVAGYVTSGRAEIQKM